MVGPSYLIDGPSYLIDDGYFSVMSKCEEYPSLVDGNVTTDNGFWLHSASLKFPNMSNQPVAPFLGVLESFFHLPTLK